MDFLIVLAGWFVFHTLFEETINMYLRHLDSGFADAGVVLGLFWFVIFVVGGSYKKLYLVSRLDEFIKVLKLTVIGSLILYFLLDLGIYSVEYFEKV